MSIIKRALPDKIPIKVTEVMPRIKEGGAFVDGDGEVHGGENDKLKIPRLRNLYL